MANRKGSRPKVGLFTKCSSFRHVLLLHVRDFIFVASNEPLRFDMAYLRKVLARPAVARCLAAARLPSQAAPLLCRIQAEEPSLDAWAGTGDILTDDHPALEFITARNRFVESEGWVPRTLEALSKQEGYTTALPVDDLLVPAADGGRLFPEIGLRLDAGLSCHARLHRRVRWQEGRMLLILYGTIDFHLPGVAARLTAVPSAHLPSPARLHQELGGLVQSASMCGHAASRQLASRGPGKGSQALLTWICPKWGATYVLRVSSPDPGHAAKGLSDIAARIGCSHP